MSERKLIYIASPYGAPTAQKIQENLDFVKKAGHAVIQGGHTPVIVHLVYPAILNDDVPEERALGCLMDLQLLDHCDALVYYAHKGVSRGMDGEIRYALEHGVPVYRMCYIGDKPVQIADVDHFEKLERTSVYYSANKAFAFRLGQTVYTLDMDKRRPSGPFSPKDLEQWNAKRVMECEITKIGRKFVTVQRANGNSEYQFSAPEYDTGGALVEKTDMGAPMYLFPSRAALDAHLKREELRDWVRTDGKRALETASAEQLKAIKDILEDGLEC